MDFNVTPITGEKLDIDAEHRAMVQKLMKPGNDILATLTPEKCDLWHAVSGVGGEAGELVDAIKKHVAYNKPLDRENVIEELGDLEFYMEALRNRLLITREETLRHNYAKLAKRYEGHNYSDAAAHARADKAEAGETPKGFIAHTDTRKASLAAAIGMLGLLTGVSSSNPKFPIGTEVIATWAPGSFAGKVVDYEEPGEWGCPYKVYIHGSPAQGVEPGVYSFFESDLRLNNESEHNGVA
jgi:NTP pyrophosphatase (non-canonical NTP hydrolase)